MGRLIEGLWDCDYCGTKGNRGSVRECPNCGRPRDEKTKFYMPQTVTYVPEEKAKTINRNPDWICPYCNSLNSDSYTNCESCGSLRTVENYDYFSIRKQDESSNVEESNSRSMDKSDYVSSHKERTNIPKTQGFFTEIFRNHWKYFVLIPLILALLIGVVYLLVPKSEEINITGFEWERSINIEKYQTVNESGLSLPTGARLQDTKLEISHYQSVLDHYETRTRQVERQRIGGYETYVSGYRDLGNGYFEEITSERPIYETYYETETYQEPVYRNEPVFVTKYYYEIDKWLYERTVSTSGEDKNPYWGEPNLCDNERVSNKSEKYYIIGLNSKGKERKISLDCALWKDLILNQKVKMKISLLGDGELIE